MKLYQCDNCPDKPKYASMEELQKHWSLTHSTSLVVTEPDPWGERKPRTRTLYSIVEVP